MGSLLHISKILLFFFCVVGVTEAHLDYGDDLVYQTCHLNDLPSSTFTHNLDSAFQTLASLSSFTRYATSTIGSGEGKMHAMFQCRGDLSPQGCMQCLAKAIALLHTGCPYSDAVDIQLNACYLRYENRSFTASDFEFVQSSCRWSTMTDSVSLQAEVEKAISAAPRNGGYAVAQGSNGYVGIAQCLGYLSEMECAQCLSKAASYYNGSSVLGDGYCPSESVHLTGCYYRYEKNDYLSASFAMRPCNTRMLRRPPKGLNPRFSRGAVPMLRRLPKHPHQLEQLVERSQYPTDAANLRKLLQMKDAAI